MKPCFIAGSTGAGAGLEAVVVGEELDIEDAEGVELVEEVGGRVGGRAEAIVGMRAHPLAEVPVGDVEVEVVEGVVAVVERGAGEGCAEGEDGGCKKKQQEGSGEREAPGDSGRGWGGPGCRRRKTHSFLLPHWLESALWF
ncbi:hypothetical protein RBB78_09460 [Tunturiibacter empetritectus]|uniref:hypothetical protein n=1 Tax=Tunturiibacter empetritectus TaxID=3069691 RepID=UPI003D9ACDDD